MLWVQVKLGQGLRCDLRRLRRPQRHLSPLLAKFFRTQAYRSFFWPTSNVWSWQTNRQPIECARLDTDELVGLSVQPRRPRPGQGPRLSCGRYPVRGVVWTDLDGLSAIFSASGGARFLQMQNGEERNRSRDRSRDRCCDCCCDCHYERPPRTPARCPVRRL